MVSYLCLYFGSWSPGVKWLNVGCGLCLKEPFYLFWRFFLYEILSIISDIFACGIVTNWMCAYMICIPEAQGLWRSAWQFADHIKLDDRDLVVCWLSFSRYKIVENRKYTEWPQNDHNHLIVKKYPAYTEYSPWGSNFTPRFATRPAVFEI